jgi:putative transposase
MARENPIWGEERIADELLVKLGIRVSARTVSKYLKSGKPRGSSGQRWSTFVRNHAQSVVACDFLVSVTASFQLLYVFVAMEIGSRRILHTNVTAHPTAEWTMQQFREFLAFDHPYRFVIHDRDSIFSPRLDTELRVGTWNSGAAPSQGSGHGPQTQAARRLPRYVDAGFWRVAS